MLESVWNACKDQFKQAFLEFTDQTSWKTAQETEWPLNRKISDGNVLADMSALWQGKGYPTDNAAFPEGASPAKAYASGKLFRINGYSPAQGSPFAEPCPAKYFEQPSKNGDPVLVSRDHPRLYKSAYIQFDLTVNKYGWHDPQARMPVLGRRRGSDY